MSSHPIIAIVALLILLGLIVALQVWWRRHRAHETSLQKKQEDRELDAESEIW